MILRDLFVYNETPTPTVNGVVTTFATAHPFRTGSLVIYRRGSRLFNDEFAETTSQSFTLTVAPDSDEPLLVDYMRLDITSENIGDLITTIIGKIRDLIEDNAEDFSEVHVYEENQSNSIFTVGELSVNSIDDVFLNNEELASGTWDFDSQTNKLEILSGTTLTSGDVIEIQGNSYPNYSNLELKAYIRAALIELSNRRFGTYKYDEDYEVLVPEPTEEEQNLIASIAAILIRPDYTLRLPDIGLTRNKMSKEERIGKLLSAYKHGIGLFSNLSFYKRVFYLD